MGKTMRAAPSPVKPEAKEKKPQQAVKTGKKPSSLRYKNESRWVTNRAKRIARHLKRHPMDVQAQNARA